MKRVRDGRASEVMPGGVRDEVYVTGPGMLTRRPMRACENLL